MSQKTCRNILALSAFMMLEGCAAPKSNTLPDYAATRVKVNTGSAQSASLEAKSASVEIKNSKDEISSLANQISVLKEDVQASRIRLAR